jgi:hypothetical protein
VCAFLLNLLNKQFKTKFVVSDVHSNITPCALPEWFPGNIVRSMVVEFGRRLKEELCMLQESTGQRRQADTTDTVRMSMDSIRSTESQGREDDFSVNAFSSHPNRSSESGW